MQRLEITGSTPEEFYFNVINTLSLILRGPQTAAVAPVEPVAEAVAIEDTVVEQSEQEVAPPVKKRGRPAKAAEPAKSDELDDPVPDLGGGAPAKELTLDGDIKPRLQAIAAACTKRGMSMPGTVAYCQKLYAPFGIAKAPQLKPEQFEEFMEASEAYLSGEAEA